MACGKTCAAKAGPGQCGGKPCAPKGQPGPCCGIKKQGLYPGSFVGFADCILKPPVKVADGLGFSIGTAGGSVVSATTTWAFDQQPKVDGRLVTEGGTVTFRADNGQAINYGVIIPGGCDGWVQLNSDKTVALNVKKPCGQATLLLARKSQTAPEKASALELSPALKCKESGLKVLGNIKVTGLTVPLGYLAVQIPQKVWFRLGHCDADIYGGGVFYKQNSISLGARLQYLLQTGTWGVGLYGGYKQAGLFQAGTEVTYEKDAPKAQFILKGPIALEKAALTWAAGVNTAGDVKLGLSAQCTAGCGGLQIAGSRLATGVIDVQLVGFLKCCEGGRVTLALSWEKLAADKLKPKVGVGICRLSPA